MPFSSARASASACTGSGSAAGSTSPNRPASRSASWSSVPRRRTRPGARAGAIIILLLSSRRHAGRGIGTALVNKAIDEAYARAAEVLRVDCWAHAPGLVRWYEKQGFSRSNRFELNGWQGQIFTMDL